MVLCFGERKEGEKGSLLGPQGQEPIPSRPLWAVQSILQECHDPDGAPVKAVFSRNATRRTMAPLKQKSHCETKMSEWDQGLYSTADRAQWAGRARVTEGQLWPKGHRSFCVTRMGLSGGSLYISTCVHPSEPGPGPVPTGTQSRPLAAARLVETHAGLGDGGVLGRRRRGRRRGWAPPGVSQGGLHEGGGFEVRPYLWGEFPQVVTGEGHPSGPCGGGGGEQPELGQGR